MKRVGLIALAALAVVSVLITLILISRKPSAHSGRVSVAFLGSTNFVLGSKLGDGTPRFPLFDPGALGITNAPESGRVGLFMLTNGTSQTVYCSLETIEVLSGGNWIKRTPEWPGFGWELGPGESCIQPVPEPRTDLSWRIRLGVVNQGRALKQAVDRVTVKHAQTVFFPGERYEIFSDMISDRSGEPADAHEPPPPDAY